MTFKELLQAAREELRDTTGTADSDFALTRSMALRYFNEAVSEACRRSRLLIDSDTPEICTINVVAGTAVYDLDERVVKILGADLAGRSTPLFLVCSSDMPQGWKDHAGSVQSIVKDYATGKIRLYRVPEADGVITLKVQRTPLVAMASDSDRPEIHSRYHFGLVPFVVAKVRMIDDTELFDPAKAAKAEAEFEREFGPKRSASNEAYENSQQYNEDE